jgi:hypothetical protein
MSWRDGGQVADYVTARIVAVFIGAWRKGEAVNRSRPVLRRVWLPATVAGAGLLVLIAVLIWAPAGVRGWLVGVVAAALASYLANGLVRWEPGWRTRWRRGRDGEPNPLAVTVQILGAHYVLVRASEEDIEEIPSSGHLVRMVVEAVGESAVLLTGLRPVVLRREHATGQLNPHLGAVETRQFEVLLDTHPPTLHALGRDFPFKVTEDDPEVFDLVVRTDDGQVHWVLDLEWVSAGRSGVYRVDLAGHPFRTIARPVPQIGQV